MSSVLTSLIRWLEIPHHIDDTRKEEKKDEGISKDGRVEQKRGRVI